MFQQSSYKLGLTVFMVAILVFLYVRSNRVNNIEILNSQKEGQTYSWEEYLEDRDKRNLAKMNKTYMEMMSLGRVLVEEKEYAEAINRFYTAKTLFPYRLEPRKNLCYAYLLRCRENQRYCRLAKRELYYAVQYIEDGDLQSAEYLENLINLVEMKDILNLPEGEAMAAIF